MARTAPKADAKAKPMPVHKSSTGALQLAIWRNEYSDQETGEVRTFHTVQLERNYKDKDDEWKKTSQLRESDLGDAIALLQNAQQWLLTDKEA